MADDVEGEVGHAPAGLVLGLAVIRPVVVRVGVLDQQLGPRLAVRDLVVPADAVASPHWPVRVT